MLLLRRPWASHEEGENNGKTDAVDTIVIRSADIESSILVQLSHETMFAVVIFKVASFWGLAPHHHRGSAPEARCGTSVAQTTWLYG